MADYKAPLAAIVILGLAAGQVLSQCENLSALRSSQSVLDACRRAVTKAANKVVNHPSPRLPGFPDYECHLDLTFNKTAEQVKFCCENYDIAGKVFQLDPLKTDSPPNLEDLSVAPGVQVVCNEDGSGKKYTLLFLDLDSEAIRFRVQWLVVNIADIDSVLEGEVVITYEGPITSVTCMMIIYEQTENIDVSALNFAQYISTGGPRCMGETRCNFTEGDFRTNNQLAVRGVTWVKPSTTDYGLYGKFKSGNFPKDELCNGRQDVVSADRDNVVCEGDTTTATVTATTKSVGPENTNGGDCSSFYSGLFLPLLLSARLLL